MLGLGEGGLGLQFWCVFGFGCQARLARPAGGERLWANGGGRARSPIPVLFGSPHTDVILACRVPRRVVYANIELITEYMLPFTQICPLSLLYNSCISQTSSISSRAAS